MAKELPYFKFEPSEWQNGDIQMLEPQVQLTFINICCTYWTRLGKLPYAFALHKHCNGNTEILDMLINCNIIKVNDKKDLSISFLDTQLVDVKLLSSTRSDAANARWAKVNDANALQMESKSNAIRRDKIRRDKIIKDKNKEVHPPEIKEFLDYAIEKSQLLNYNYCEQKTKGKFLAWQENNWVNGNGRKIKNWKTSLLNTLPHIQNEKGSAQKENGLDILREFNRRAKENEHLNNHE